jgi:[ribosomal protein S5]-alanine N-acetyltransferase
MGENVRAELGYALKPHFWGKGYMKEVLFEVLRFGLDQLGLHSLEANVNPENIASVRLLESVGFLKEGHFKENYLFGDHFVDADSLLETGFKF